MTLYLIYRHPNDGISISKVFDCLEPYFKEYFTVKKIYLPAKVGSFKGILENLNYIRKIRKQSGVFLVTGAAHYLSLVLPPKRTIMVVHDLKMLQNISLRNPKDVVKYLLWGKSLSIFKHIICISNQTKKECLCIINNKQVEVIPDPISDNYRFYSYNTYSKGKINILHIGTKDNKNLGRTIEALRNINCHLSIVGKLSATTISKLHKLGFDFSNKVNISERELLEEYVKCNVLNFPSTYEGFGMPIIEAQALGRICITSNIEPMKTVAGEGAFFVDPFDVQSIRNGYEDIIKNPSLQEIILKRGIENAKKYSAKSIASKYIKLINGINV